MREENTRPSTLSATQRANMLHLRRKGKKGEKKEAYSQFNSVAESPRPRCVVVSACRARETVSSRRRAT